MTQTEDKQKFPVKLRKSTKFESSRMLLHICLLMVVSILEEHRTFIYMIKQFLGHIMKIKSLRSFEGAVTIYQSKGCYIPKDSNLEQHCSHKLNIAKQIQLKYRA